MSSKQEEKRKAIICKYLENPDTAYKKIAQEVGVCVKTVGRTIKRYKQLTPLSRTPGSGRKSGPANQSVALKVKRLFTKNPGTSVRDMAAKAGTSKSMVQRIKKFYNQRNYKVQKVPDRSEEKDVEAKKRARKLNTNI